MHTRYRHALPQMNGDMFLTDGGIETTLIFHDGLDLPYFAAFDLLKSETGRSALDRYFRRYAAIAHDRGVGFVLESATWRASQEWGGCSGLRSMTWQNSITRPSPCCIRSAATSRHQHRVLSLVAVSARAAMDMIPVT